MKHKFSVVILLAIAGVFVSQIAFASFDDCDTPSVKDTPGESLAKTPLAQYTLDDVLERLSQETSKLQSYQCKVKYLFIQDPELLDSRTLRNGVLYYKKDKDGSRIRVNFDTLKQDDDKEQKQKQQFMFDGVWLTRLDAPELMGGVPRAEPSYP